MKRIGTQQQAQAMGVRRRQALARVAAGGLAALGMALGASPVFAQATEKLTVRLDWVPWGSQAAIHLASQKGWFKEQGLEPAIEDGNGSVTTVQLVGTGKFDIGYASLAPMIIARNKGLSIKAIANFSRKNDIGLMVPKGGSIKSAHDLAGKKLIFTAGSLEAPFLDSFLAAGGLKRDQVELIAVDAASKVPSYIAGRGDGVFSSVPNVLASVEATKASEAILFADVGLQFPSFGLVASEDTIKAKPVALRKFASVVAGAWAYIQRDKAHVDEAVAAIMAQRPQSKLDPRVLKGMTEDFMRFFNTPLSGNAPIGVMVPAEWAAGLKVMEGARLIGPANPAEYYTNDLLDLDLMKRIASR
jgi:NitT/TauT family transport system substrate-binding protein